MNMFMPYFDKGKTPRPVQIEALDWLASCWNNGKPKALSIPVGGGKSAIARTIARYNEAKGLFTAINTCTNILVDQYAADYPDDNTLKGASNYTCSSAEGYNCEERRLLQKGAGRQLQQLECYNKCPYIKARRRVYKDKVTFFNPLSYAFMPKKLWNMHKELVADATPDTLVIDEFHNLPSMLRGQFETVLWQDDVSWKQGVSSDILSVVAVLKSRIDLIRAQFSAHLPEKKRLMLDREMTKLNSVIKEAELSPQLFVAEEKIEQKYNRRMSQLSIRPVFVPLPYVERFFAQRISSSGITQLNNIVLMSGTTFPHHWKELGFNDVDYFDCPSPIPKENRQIVVRSVVKNSLKTNQVVLIETLAKSIEKIAIQHSTESGIVLATYKQAEQLQAYLTDPVYLFHTKDNKAEVIRAFVESGTTERRIAVLAGSWEGLDLKGDISRFTIITKLPFANLGDKVVKRRMELDQVNGDGSWYSLEAMQFVMQGSGRSTRGPEDYSTTYILDSNFQRVYAQCKPKLPQWFKESVIFQR